MTEKGYDPQLLNAVLSVNDRQPLRMVEILEKRLGSLSGKTVAVLGLAFKPGTDDVRDSPAIPIVQSLLDKNAKVLAFDVEAIRNFQKKFPAISYAPTGQEAIDASDAVLLVTDWPQFNLLEYDEKTVIDGKNVLDSLHRAGLAYYEGICW
jgi:UDPglucose 6-dehydrogenase